MEPLSLRDIADVVDGEFLSPPPSPEALRRALVNRVVIDSRTIQKGDLFVAFPGSRTDGHLFVAEAFKKGAAGCLVSRQISETKGGPLILVPDSEKALMRLASWYRLKIHVPVVAITGSSGKSTTKEMTAHLLSLHFPVLKAPESYNNEIGVPLTLLEWESSKKAVVLEMAMRGKGQIKELCTMASPTAGLVTSIGEAHIGLLGSVKEIADAKGELLLSLPTDGLAFLNGEDSWTPYLAEKTPCPVRTFGFHPSCWVHARSIQESWEGTKAELVTPFGNRFIFLSLLGRHNLLDFVGASAVALSFGVSLDEIAKGASSSKALHGRFRYRKGKSQIKILDDTYNANPSSLEAAMQMAASLPAQGRRILVLGDMLELGSHGETAHRQAGEKVVQFGFNALFGLGELTLFAVEEASNLGLPKASHYADHEKLFWDLKRFLKTGDVVLVKGSRKMMMEKIVDRLLLL